MKLFLYRKALRRTYSVLTASVRITSTKLLKPFIPTTSRLLSRPFSTVPKILLMQLISYSDTSSYVWLTWQSAQQSSNIQYTFQCSHSFIPLFHSVYQVYFYILHLLFPCHAILSTASVRGEPGCIEQTGYSQRWGRGGGRDIAICGLLAAHLNF